MTNKEIVIKTFKELEKHHINMYHDISKEEFNKKKDVLLEIADNLDKVHFDAEMCKLFATLKDAHTRFYTQEKRIDLCVKCISKEFYYYDTNKQICEKIKCINGHKTEDVIRKLSETISYEVEPLLYDILQYKLCSLTRLKMIDCENSENDNQIEFTLKDNSKVIKKMTRKPFAEEDNYSYKYDGKLLIVDYNVCYDKENYPFIEFLEDIKKSYKNLPEACLVDFRNNSGGNDAIIFPLIDWLNENNIKTYALMNGGVFSGGVMGLIDFKYYLNATLIGTDAGQSAHCYGECREIKIDDCIFTYCRKYFNQTTFDTHQSVKEFPTKKVVDYLGPIHPDIYLEEKPEDVRKGIDGQLNETLEIIKNDIEKLYSVS